MAIYNKSTMPIFFLFIASLAVFTVLLPENILSFLRPIQQWLAHRQDKREECHSRQKFVDTATSEWIAKVRHSLTHITTDPNKRASRSSVIQLIAAGERYLQTVSHEEEPQVCRMTHDLITDLDQKLNAPKKIYAHSGAA